MSSSFGEVGNLRLPQYLYGRTCPLIAARCFCAHHSGRTADRHATLHCTSFSGYYIPANTTVMVHIAHFVSETAYLLTTRTVLLQVVPGWWPI